MRDSARLGGSCGLSCSSLTRLPFRFEGVGGDGDDILTLNAASAGPAGNHYLAGNAGCDTYQFANGAGNVMIEESDGCGVMVDPQGRTIVGLAKVTDPARQVYSLDGNQLKLTAENQVAEAPHDPSATDQLQVDFGAGDFSIQVPDYTPGEFGIGYTNGLQQVNFKASLSGSASMLSNGLFVTVSTATMPQIVLQVVDINGEVLKTTQFSPAGSNQGVGVAVEKNGDICINYVQLLQDGSKTMNLYYQTFDKDLNALSGEQGNYGIAGTSLGLQGLAIDRLGNIAVDHIIIPIC